MRRESCENPGIPEQKTHRRIEIAEATLPSQRDVHPTTSVAVQIT